MTLRITTHYQVSITERRDMDRGICETSRKFSDRRPDYVQKRTWTNSTADKEARAPKFSFCGPDWLHPRRLAEMMTTRTSTIWGCAGRMADVEL